MIGGVLNINGTPVKMEELQIDPRYDAIIRSESYAGSSPRYFRETLPEGRSYVVIDLEQNGGADDTDVFEVPAGQYFVMGDNRDNSMDSRYGNPLGYVPLENFIGPYTARFYNSLGTPLYKRPE
jgi:signal peptidase I